MAPPRQGKPAAVAALRAQLDAVQEKRVHALRSYQEEKERRLAAVAAAEARIDALEERLRAGDALQHRVHELEKLLAAKETPAEKESGPVELSRDASALQVDLDAANARCAAAEKAYDAATKELGEKSQEACRLQLALQAKGALEQRARAAEERLCEAENALAQRAKETEARKRQEETAASDLRVAREELAHKERVLQTQTETIALLTKENEEHESALEDMKKMGVKAEEERRKMNQICEELEKEKLAHQALKEAFENTAEALRNAQGEQLEKVGAAEKRAVDLEQLVAKRDSQLAVKDHECDKVKLELESVKTELAATSQSLKNLQQDLDSIVKARDQALTALKQEQSTNAALSLNLKSETSRWKKKLAESDALFAEKEQEMSTFVERLQGIKQRHLAEQRVLETKVDELQMKLAGANGRALGAAREAIAAKHEVSLMGERSRRSKPSQSLPRLEKEMLAEYESLGLLPKGSPSSLTWHCLDMASALTQECSKEIEPKQHSSSSVGSDVDDVTSEEVPRCTSSFNIKQPVLIESCSEEEFQDFGDSVNLSVSIMTVLEKWKEKDNLISELKEQLDAATRACQQLVATVKQQEDALGAMPLSREGKALVSNS